MTTTVNLSNTDDLMNHLHWFQQTIQNPAAKSHRGVAINYLDLSERRDSFIRELKSTASSWVYSKKRYSTILNKELESRNQDVQNAISYLHEVMTLKFRKGCPQGQYGELLLFNFIQHFFKAAPLLRKMPITTNPGLERHGADAIHYLNNGNNQIFFLGESKCYESKYKFNEALTSSVNSILNSIQNIENELLLYRYDDFIEPELQSIADNLLKGKLKDPVFELVCLIVYEENKNTTAPSAPEIRKKIEECVTERWNNVNKNLYSNFNIAYISRIHYIVFPSWSLSNLLSNFEG
ncbi:DUF1837 domain-containing protein [Enterobacter sp. ECC-019]|uniref:HamA C-terminal domain-containing protein n=1 Tax=Enterobacterales TaxID=91347 RepID=UPI0036F59DB3